VRRAEPHESPDLKAWSMATCLTEVPRSEFDFVGELDYKHGRDTHWIYLSEPDDAFDAYDRIGRKLKIEARQAAGVHRWSGRGCREWATKRYL
jgi:hypothetical protein